MDRTEFNSLDNKIQICYLIDFYGGLLTDKQRKLLCLRYEEDLSLSEISEELNVSRQAAHDLITRSVEKLLDFESKLLFVEKSLKLNAHITKAISAIDRGESKDAMSALKLAKSILEED